MSGAARIEPAPDAFMGKELADEIKYGESYVGHRDVDKVIKKTQGERSKATSEPAKGERAGFARDGAAKSAERRGPAQKTDASETMRQAAPADHIENPRERQEAEHRTVEISVPAVSMPLFASLGHSAWHGAVEADPSLLEDFWDDERSPKGQIKASRRRHRRVHGVGAESRAARASRVNRLFSVLNAVEPWIADAELSPRKRRRN